MLKHFILSTFWKYLIHYQYLHYSVLFMAPNYNIAYLNNIYLFINDGHWLFPFLDYCEKFCKKHVNVDASCTYWFHFVQLYIHIFNSGIVDYMVTVVVFVIVILNLYTVFYNGSTFPPIVNNPFLHNLQHLLASVFLIMTILTGWDDFSLWFGYVLPKNCDIEHF